MVVFANDIKRTPQQDQKYNFVERYRMPDYTIAQIHTPRQGGGQPVGLLVHTRRKTTYSPNNHSQYQRIGKEVAGIGALAYYLLAQFHPYQSA